MKDTLHTVVPVPVRTEDDIAALCRMADGIWYEYFTPIIGKAQVAYMVDKFQSVPAVTGQLADGYEYYFLTIDGVPVGYTGIHPEEHALFLSKLYLKKEHRGKGYARQALNFLEALCRERGLHSIYLTVNRHNDNTIAAYKAMGLSVIREQKADIGNGFFMDDYVMEKRIS